MFRVGLDVHKDLPSREVATLSLENACAKVPITLRGRSDLLPIR